MKTPLELHRRANTQGRSLILVNPPVVDFQNDGSGAAYLDLMVGDTPPSNYFSIPIEHIGLLSIKAFAQAHGLSVEIVNGIVHKHRSVRETWASILEVVRVHGPPAVIGFSQILAFEQSAWLARRAKETWPDTTTVFGHDFAALNWRRILTNYPEVDYVSVGDGESAFTELASCILNGRSAQKIAGLAGRSSEGVAHLQAPPSLLCLDELPWPSREELPMVKALGFAPAVAASRGCPYKCAYCTTGQVTRTLGSGAYRHRSAESLAEEMMYLWKYEGCEFINICDDLFITPSHASRQRAAEFASALARRHYGGTYMIDARVDSIEPQLFKRLYETGLRRVFVGVETGDPTLLASFDKKYKLRGDSIERRLRSLIDLGLEVIPGIIAFHPTVRPEELRETLNVMHMMNFKAPYMLMSPVIVFPGTTLHTEYQQRGFLREEWPMGLWRFADKRAEQAYKEIAGLVGESAGKDFEAFAKEVGIVLDRWERDRAETGPRLFGVH